jgi:hypothetical protein
MTKKIVESYRQKLANEEGWIGQTRRRLRIALCYPNTHSIGMANLGMHTMYELFNKIPEVSCERVFLPDDSEMREYEKSRTPLLSLETQTPIRDFDVVAFSISFETDYLNMAKMLQLVADSGLGGRAQSFSPARRDGRRGFVPESRTDCRFYRHYRRRRRRNSCFQLS